MREQSVRIGFPRFSFVWIEVCALQIDDFRSDQL